MTRRIFGLLCFLAVVAFPGFHGPMFAAGQGRGRTPAAPSPDLFEVYEQSILALQAAQTEGRVTSRALVDAYLARIAAYDQAGPRLNSIVTLNPHAREDADALDRERAQRGPRGPGRVVFFPSLSPSASNDRRGIYRKRADGVVSEELLHEALDIRPNIAFTVSPDGSVLLYGAAGDVWVLPDPLGTPGTSRPRTLFQTPFSGNYLQFSPDGHWIAYQSLGTGRAEVYVMPYPGPGPSRQISTAGGSKPRWRADGKEIFFVVPDGRIALAEVSIRNGALESGEPQMLFNPQMPEDPAYYYDVSADGQGILAITPRAATEGLTIVQNWPALLKK